jgi:hypothetical protein
MVIGEDYEKQLAPFDENLENVQEAKWDWYSVGGRWTGYFKVKKGPKYRACTGEPGVMGRPAKRGWADQIRKCDIDVEAMQRVARQDADAFWDELEAAVVNCPPPAYSWEEAKKKWPDIEEARKHYHEQPFVKAAFKLHLADLVEVYRKGRQEYVNAVVRRVLVPFAVVHEGKWREKGSMGWWGMVSDEKDVDEWAKWFYEMFSELPADTLLTLVDCHI